MRPDEPKLFLYSKILEWSWDLLPDSFRNGLEQYLFYVSPAVPVHLSRSSEDGVPWYVFRAGTGVAFVSCFVVTAVWNLLNGTWSGTEPNRLYFSRDINNLLQYTFICPTIVGLSVALVCLTLTSWPRLSAASERVRAPKPIARPASLASILLFILLSAALISANYLRECLDPSIYHRVGWYVREVTSGGVRVLGGLGVYYIILNYTLLVTCLAGVFSYLSLSVACVRVGPGIADYPSMAPELSFDDIKQSLSAFTNGYLLAKLLTAALMLNTFAWRWEHPVGSLNMSGMGLGMSVLGVFFVSVPRYYVELEWFRYKTRTLQSAKTAPNQDDATSVDDLRPFSTKLWVYIVDVLLISGFITSFWW